jgi:hypothetical protein
MEESAYAHLGNAAMILMNVLSEDLPPHTQCVTVSVEELRAVLSRIEKARTVIHHYAQQVTGGVHV